MAATIQAELKLITGGATGGAPGGGDLDLNNSMRDIAQHFKRSSQIFGGSGFGRLESYLLGAGGAALFAAVAPIAAAAVLGTQAWRELTGRDESEIYPSGFDPDEPIASSSLNTWLSTSMDKAIEGYDYAPMASKFKNLWNKIFGIEDDAETIAGFKTEEQEETERLFGGSGLFGTTKNPPKDIIKESGEALEEVNRIVEDGVITQDEMATLMREEVEMSKERNQIQDSILTGAEGLSDELEFSTGVHEVINGLIDLGTGKIYNEGAAISAVNELLREKLRLMKGITRAEQRDYDTSAARRESAFEARAGSAWSFSTSPLSGRTVGEIASRRSYALPEEYRENVEGYEAARGY